MKTILGMGAIWLALGVLILFPAALRSRNELMKIALYEAGKVAMLMGTIGLLAAGMLILAT